MIPSATSLSYSCGVASLSVSHRHGFASTRRSVNSACSRLLGKAEHTQVRLLRAQKTLPRNKLCKPAQASTVELERDVEKENSRQYRRTVHNGTTSNRLTLSMPHSAGDHRCLPLTTGLLTEVSRGTADTSSPCSRYGLAIFCGYRVARTRALSELFRRHGSAESNCARPIEAFGHLDSNCHSGCDLRDPAC